MLSPVDLVRMALRWAATRDDRRASSLLLDVHRATERRAALFWSEGIFGARDRLEGLPAY